MKSDFVVPQNDRIEYIIGIDFGHGETSAAICRVDNMKDPEDIEIARGQKAIPSVMYIETKAGIENIYIGGDAVKVYGGGGNGEFYACFKHAPDTLDESKDTSIRIMKLFMKRVYETICLCRAGELMEGDKVKPNHVVFIACPSQSQSWDEKAMQKYVQLALEAGLPIAGGSIDNKFRLSGIVRESRAAYIRALQKDEAKQIATKGILVVDYGSSTIDITYYGEGEKPIDKGYPKGASLVEKKIFDYLKDFHEDLEGEQNPKAIKQIETTHPSMATKLLYDIRKGKEAYYSGVSTANGMEIHFKFMPRIQAEKIDVEIPKDTIEKDILKTYILDVQGVFEDFKNNVIKNRPVTLLVMTGGASRMNFAEELLKKVFGEKVKMLSPQDPSLTVSNGIAIAGRADVLLYKLAEDLLSKEMKTIYFDVLSKSKQKICDKIIKEVESAYKCFLNGDLSNNTINAIEKKVNQNLNSIKPSYKELLNASFRECMEEHINEVILPDINSYVKTHFPHYNVTQVKRYSVPEGVSMSISWENSQAISTSFDDSVIQITEGFIEGSAKLAYNIFALVSFGAGAVIDNAVIFMMNQFRANNNQIEYISFDDVMSLTMDFNDKNTDLNEEKRQKVYETFASKKSDYATSLQKEIEDKLPSFKEECDKVQKETVLEYLISEINRIQLQIK